MFRSIPVYVRTAEKVIGALLLTLLDIYNKHCICRSLGIANDPTHLLCSLFLLMQSGKKVQDHSLKGHAPVKQFLPLHQSGC